MIRRRVATPARLAIALVSSILSARPAGAIESQALGIVGPLPAQIARVFRCGEWSDNGRSGHYRIVLIDVSEGAGSEVYIQRIQETAPNSSRVLALLETTPVRELNDDQAQYQVSSARCIRAAGRSAVALTATFEHDEGDVEHRIRISLSKPGSYSVRNAVVGTRRKTRGGA